MRTRLGLVGLGLIWEHYHSMIVDKMGSSFEVTAVCDNDPEKVAKWKGKYPKASAYSDYKELVMDKGIDVVVVMTPIKLNPRVTIAGLKAGKDVFCEKPLAYTIKDVDEIIATEKASGKRVYVMENYRYNPQIAVISDIIASGRLGKTVMFEKAAHHMIIPEIDNTVNFARVSWRLESDYPLGHMYDNGIHDLAVLAALFGLPAEMFSLGTKLREDMGEYHNVISMFKYDNGLTGVFGISSMLGCKPFDYFYVRCVEGTISVEINKVTVEFKRGGREVYDVVDGGHEDMWQVFAKLREKGEEPWYTSLDARNAIRILDAVGKSIASGNSEGV